MHIQHDLWRHIPQGIWRHAVANLQRNWSNSGRLTKFAARLTQFATMIILISNIDLVEYVYSAIVISSVGDLFHCCVAKTQTWILNIGHGRPIESFWLDRVLSTRFSRLLFRRPYCLPLSANRIFSAGRCIVYPFFSAIIPSPLFFTLLGQ